MDFPKDRSSFPILSDFARIVTFSSFKFSFLRMSCWVWKGEKSHFERSHVTFPHWVVQNSRRRSGQRGRKPRTMVSWRRLGELSCGNLAIIAW